MLKERKRKGIASDLYRIDQRIFGHRHYRRGVMNRGKTALFIVALLALPVANWLIFWLFINIQSIALAFKSARTGEFTWDNFLTFYDQLTNPLNNEIGLATKNTLLYFGASIFISLPLSLVIAYFFYKKIAGYKFFRIIFYLPAIISGVAMVTAFKEFIDPQGPLGKLIVSLGGKVSETGLLGSSTTATPTIIFYTVFTGFTTNVLLFSGAMSRVPTEVLESAKLEGAGQFRELIEIILPLIWPTISTQFIFTMTGLFTASGPILLFDSKNLFNTQTLSYWIFRQVYETGPLAYNLVAATGLCFTLIGFPLILIARKLTDKVAAVEY